ncbi:MAG: site-2 protease family protein [Bacillota bacterium]|nr:site-2 protease family protein [Bacillota bacterium]
MKYILMRVYLLPIILLSLSVHELSHGYAAYKLGDNTAKSMGRLTLNPISHIDIIGTIAMMVFGFGWAKPVPVDFGNLKYKRAGTAIVALAGPFSNIIMAFLSSLAYALLAIFVYNDNTQGFIMDYLGQAIILNIVLAVFNMIPIPPLDGSKVVLSFLPQKWQFMVYKYERLIGLVLFALLFSGALSPVINKFTVLAWSGLGRLAMGIIKLILKVIKV